MSVRQLIIDGVTIPVYSSVELEQRYGKRRAAYRATMRSGVLKQRRIWPQTGAFLTTTISGRGLIPAGIGEDGSIDYDNPIVISCVAPRSILSASNTIVLPAARRTDSGSLPYGRALVNDRWQNTPVSIITNTATLTAVAGASQYQCVYFPEITCFADPPSEDHPQRGPSYNWALTAEEIGS